MSTLVRRARRPRQCNASLLRSRGLSSSVQQACAQKLSWVWPHSATGAFNTHALDWARSLEAKPTCQFQVFLKEPLVMRREQCFRCWFPLHEFFSTRTPAVQAQIPDLILSKIESTFIGPARFCDSFFCLKAFSRTSNLILQIAWNSSLMWCRPNSATEAFVTHVVDCARRIEAKPTC